MDENFLNRVKSEALAFNKKLELQIAELKEENLISENDIERLKRTAMRYLEALDKSLNIPLTSSIQETLILSLVQDYEGKINEEIKKIQIRKYSDEKINNRIEELVQRYLSEITTKIHQNTVFSINQIKKEVEYLQLHIWKGLKREIRKRGEACRPLIVEQTLDILSKELVLLSEKYTGNQLQQVYEVDFSEVSYQEYLVPQGVRWCLTKEIEGKVVRYFSPEIKPNENHTNEY